MMPPSVARFSAFGQTRLASMNRTYTILMPVYNDWDAVRNCSGTWIGRWLPQAIARVCCW